MAQTVSLVLMRVYFCLVDINEKGWGSEVVWVTEDGVRVKL
jgi:hypothetical protein